MLETMTQTDIVADAFDAAMDAARDLVERTRLFHAADRLRDDPDVEAWMARHFARAIRRAAADVGEASVRFDAACARLARDGRGGLAADLRRVTLAATADAGRGDEPCPSR